MQRAECARDMAMFMGVGSIWSACSQNGGSGGDGSSGSGRRNGDGSRASGRREDAFVVLHETQGDFVEEFRI